MKSQNGVTMFSLIIYVTSFLVITTLVAGITTFFYNNVETLDTSIGSNSQYTKFNLYMLNECKKKGNTLFAWQQQTPPPDTPNNIENLVSSSIDVSLEEDTFIVFKDNNDNKNVFSYIDKKIYYNSIKLCDKVEEFKFKIDYSSGKTVLQVFINIDGTAYTTEYVLAS